jgi:hypothetical protein
MYVCPHMRLLLGNAINAVVYFSASFSTQKLQWLSLGLRGCSSGAVCCSPPVGPLGCVPTVTDPCVAHAVHVQSLRTVGTLGVQEWWNPSVAGVAGCPKAGRTCAREKRDPRWLRAAAKGASERIEGVKEQAEGDRSILTLLA